MIVPLITQAARIRYTIRTSTPPNAGATDCSDNM